MKALEGSRTLAALGSPLRVTCYLYYEADVAVPTAADAFAENAAVLYVCLDPSATVTHVRVAGDGEGLMVTSATATLPGSRSESIRDSSRWIKTDINISGVFGKRIRSHRNSNPSRVREGVRGRAQRRPRNHVHDYTDVGARATESACA